MSTFDFGYGPVPAHQHKNPDGSVGGWVADTASVSGNVHVGKLARIFGAAVILGGTILGGTILGGTIEGGTIEGGTIWGGTIEGGTIRGGTIEGGTIAKKGALYIGNLVDPETFATYQVTVTDQHIQMGCCLKTPKEWKAYTLDQCAKDHGKRAASWLKLFRPVVLKLAAQHMKRKAIPELGEVA
jgi:hypothetical protein